MVMDTTFDPDCAYWNACDYWATFPTTLLHNTVPPNIEQYILTYTYLPPSLLTYLLTSLPPYLPLYLLLSFLPSYRPTD